MSIPITSTVPSRKRRLTTSKPSREVAKPIVSAAGARPYRGGRFPNEKAASAPFSRTRPGRARVGICPC
jgi:hypothetical protein